MRVEEFRPGLAADWDALTECAAGGTLLHSRAFLDYHGDRFRDHSLVAWHPGEARLAGVLALAADPHQPGRVVSHPGSSFGGPVMRSRDPARARAFLSAAARRLAGQGFDRLLLRLAPSAVLRQPDDGLLPDLLRLGQVLRMDLWSVLRLGGPSDPRAGRLSEIRRGERKGLQAEPVATPEGWADLHRVVSDRVRQKYDRPIVHSVADLVDLHRRLGPRSQGLLVRDATGAVVAAVWCLDYGTGTLHLQYSGATGPGIGLGASSHAVGRMVEQALRRGFDRFSFGHSSQDGGWRENPGLLRFKAGFGAGLSAQYHVEIPLGSLVDLHP